LDEDVLSVALGAFQYDAVLGLAFQIDPRAARIAAPAQKISPEPGQGVRTALTGMGHYRVTFSTGTWLANEAPDHIISLLTPFPIVYAKNGRLCSFMTHIQ
jgi:hypothetical protein